MFTIKQQEQAREIATRQKRYREALIKYGIIPFLMTLERFENEERYELCQLIIDTIIRANLFKERTYPYQTDLKNEINHRIEFGVFPKEMISYTIKSFQNQANQCYNYLLNIQSCGMENAIIDFCKPCKPL